MQYPHPSSEGQKEGKKRKIIVLLGMMINFVWVILILNSLQDISVEMGNGKWIVEFMVRSSAKGSWLEMEICKSFASA